MTDRPAVSRDRALRIELCALVLCFVFPDIIAGITYPLRSHVTGGGAGSTYSLLRAVGDVAILGFLVWTSGDPLGSFGVRRPVPIRDLALGIVIAGLYVVPRRYQYATAHSWRPYQMVIERTHHSLAIHPGAAIFAGVSIAMSSLWQELLFRGMLIPRIRELTGSTRIAVPLAAALFASIHLYQGAWTLPYHFLFGLLTGVAFVRTGSIWPGVVTHTLVNMAASYWF
jgi:membrane protease YdiL (CAAX protease family)